jgi:hypothetical protein
MNESLMYGSVDQGGKRFPPLSSTTWLQESLNAWREEASTLALCNFVKASNLVEPRIPRHSRLGLAAGVSTAYLRYLRNVGYTIVPPSDCKSIACLRFQAKCKIFIPNS